MGRKVTQLSITLSLSIFAILLALAWLSKPARAADQCVAAGGGGGCFTTIQAAINAVGSGETVRVVAGTYNENVVINKSLTLVGGFADTSLINRTARTSIIDGGGAGPVIKISGNGNVTIDGFTIRNGNATTNNGQGGGIDVNGPTLTVRDNLIENNVGSTAPATTGEGGGIYITGTNSTLIENNTIQQNVAYSVTSGALAGGGGGIAILGSGTAIISGNQILSNTAAINTTPQGGSQGFGGGINSLIPAVTINNNIIQGNIGATAVELAAGGGIDVFRADAVTISHNIITHNTAAISATQLALGGGIWLGNFSGSGQQYTLTGNQITANIGALALSGPNLNGGGGGISISGGGASNDTLIMQNNILVGNTAVYTMISPNGATFLTANGGGLNVSEINQTTLISNEVRANVTVKHLTMTGNGGFIGRPSGGGIAVFKSGLVTVTDTLIKDNVTAERQTLDGVSSTSEGGGLHLNSVNNATVQNNTIINNSAVITGSLTSNTGENYFPNGGGLFLGCFDVPTCTASVQNNNISNNIAALTVTLAGSNANGGANGGGVSLNKMTTALVQSNIISGNEAHRASDGISTGAGAGINVQESMATIERNQILGNRRDAAYASGGNSGLWAWQSTVTSTNNIFARNFDGLGAGNNTTMRVINDTYYDNGQVGVSSFMSSIVFVTNTIVISHDQGLNQNGSGTTLKGNFNLISNTTNYDGGATGGVNDIINKDPLFKNAASDDFHLTSTSPAIDAGTNINAPIVDFDNDSRPQGSGIDIGADEFALDKIYLPIIVK